MRHVKKANFLATTEASESSLLLGSHKWTIHNDSKKCTPNKNDDTITLILHTCNSEEDFACNNAFCVKMAKHCDGKEDCEDGSDEQGCGKVMFKRGYKKSLTPTPEIGHNLVVNVSLKLVDILEVNELTGSFTVKLALQREWFDRRLTYRNLKQEDSNKNNLLSEESASVWYPKMTFHNVEHKLKTIATHVHNKVHRVIVNNDFGFTARNNEHHFLGSRNALSLTKLYYVEWICHYRMHWYPFDSHICTMEFLLSASDLIKLKPGRLEHNLAISLDRYTITKLQMCRSVIYGREAIVAAVTLGRPIISNILTVFIPTTTLIAISFISRFFAKDYIDMVIQVNLTILLVLATL